MVYADNNTTSAVGIPAHFEYGSNGLSPSKAYQLIMTPEDEAPMPEDAVDNASAISVSQSLGQDYAFQIPYERFPGLGEYWYKIVLKDSGNKGLGTWWAHVTVQNGKDGPVYSVTLRENKKTGDSLKIAKITAVDTDQPVPSTTVTPAPSGTVTPTPSGTVTPTPSTTTVPTSSQKSSTNAKTGDSSNTRLWIITLSVSTAMLLLFLAYLSGKQRKQKTSKE
ncbi:MAG: hypothetical protein ACI4ET_13555 [Bilifractor sp.]